MFTFSGKKTISINLLAISLNGYCVLNIDNLIICKLVIDLIFNFSLVVSSYSITQ